MKRKTEFKCKKCEYISFGFFGKCPNCEEWNTLVEVEKSSSTNFSINSENTKSVKLKDINSIETFRINTDISEFDRVMGGGIVKDSVTILTAKPGSGKSTLLLQVAGNLSNKGLKILYASGEESVNQIKQRSVRIDNSISDNVYIYSNNILDNVIEEINDINPDVIILDSIQTFSLKEFNSRAGSPTQVMECAYKLVEIAKNPKNPKIIFIIGQMTKENTLAGVRSLEHLVDTVLIIEGNEQEDLRTLLASKNRFGSTGETGFFLMTEFGLESIDNPSKYFMTTRDKGDEVSGSTLTVVKEGTRPIILEIEALTSKTFLPYPSRIGECINREHLNTLISILEERAKLKFFDKNVVLKTTGDIKLKESSSNLAIMISIVSSLKNISIDTNTIFIGDVGLTGELKLVSSINMRIKAALEMGFKKIFVPKLSIDFEKNFNFNKEYIIENNHILDVIEKINTMFKK